MAHLKRERRQWGWSLLCTLACVSYASCGGDDWGDDATGSGGRATGGRPMGGATVTTGGEISLGGRASGGGGSNGDGGDPVGGGGAAGGSGTCLLSAQLQATWSTETGKAPGARNFHAMAASGSSIVLFGGGQNNQPLGDTWVWQSEPLPAWTPAAAGPPARGAHALSATGDGGVLLFGGIGSRGTLGDTWRWQGDWQVVCDPALDASCSHPSPRSGHRMAFQAERQAVVLFGGLDSELVQGDTWEWEPALGWQKICADSDAGQVGAGGASSAGNGPAGVAGLGAASSASGAGGASGNTGCGPSPRFDHALAYAPSKRSAVLFGGTDGVQEFSDLWAYQDGTWRAIEPRNQGPGPRVGHGMVYDPASELLFVLGGTHDGAPVAGSLWALSLDTNAWYQATPSGAPPPTLSHVAMAVDAAAQQVIVQGPAARNGMPATWTLSTSFVSTDTLCACVATCTATCGSEASELCEQSCTAHPNTPAACGENGGAPGMGGAPATGGSGAGGGGESGGTNGGAGGSTGPTLGPVCAELVLQCCSTLRADLDASCRSAAVTDSEDVCAASRTACKQLSSSPDDPDAQSCFQLAYCCSTLTGSLRRSCVDALADPPSCPEFLASGFCATSG